MPFESFLRMSTAALTQLRLVHLCSEADLSASLRAAAGEAATAISEISGYTEWVSATQPQVSVGWDWTLSGPAGALTLKPASIRTNVMLRDEQGVELGFAGTVAVLATWLGRWDWQSEVRAQLQLPG